MLELDLVRRGRVRQLPPPAPRRPSCRRCVFSRLSGGLGLEGMSELSSTELRRPRCCSREADTVFLRLYLGGPGAGELGLSVSLWRLVSDSLVQPSASVSRLSLFLRSSLVALPYSILLMTSLLERRELPGARLLLLPPGDTVWGRGQGGWTRDDTVQIFPQTTDTDSRYLSLNTVLAWAWTMLQGVETGDTTQESDTAAVGQSAPRLSANTR